MDVILTLVVIAILAYIVGKKMYPTMSLLALGLIVLFAYTIITQKSVMGDSTCGNMYIDVFEYVKSKFTSTFTSTGIVLMPVMGYATYMNHIGASKKLALLAIKPFKNTKNPYILCGISIIIGGILRLAIPSQTGLVALLMVTIYPVMTAAGMSVPAATAAVVAGTAFDWGPACSTTALVLSNSTQQAQGPFFISFQLPVIAVALIVTAVLSIFVNQRADKKSNYVLGSDAGSEEQTENVNDIPGFYAFFPMLPLVIMIIFSEAVLKSVVISAFGATVFSLTVVVICEIIRNKGLAAAFAGTKQQFVGMGTCFADIVAMISCATTFAGAVQLIGGFKTMSNFIINSGLPVILLLVAVCAMVILMTMVVASSVPSVTTFAPFITGIAQAGNVANEVVLLPFILADGFSRSFSPISAVNVFASKYVNIDAVELIKRNAVPMIGGIITAMAMSLLIV